MKIILFILLTATVVQSAELKKVFTNVATKQISSEKLVFPGVVHSRVHSVVKSQIDGIVKNINVTLGEKVNAGKSLVGLKNQDETLNFQMNFLRATVSGVVADIKVSAGEFVNKGDAILTLTDPENIFVKIESPIKDIQKIKFNQLVHIKIPQLEGKILGKVVGIGAMANQSTGTVPVQISLEKNSKAMVGSLGIVEVQLAKEELLLIPESALLKIGEDVFVRKVKNKKAYKHAIKTGVNKDGMVEVISGIAINESYIVRSSGYISDGDKVEVIKESKGN